jgi:hypothetical protein
MKASGSGNVITGRSFLLHKERGADADFHGVIRRNNVGSRKHDAWVSTLRSGGLLGLGEVSVAGPNVGWPDKALFVANLSIVAY